jgi:hypothetical protein
MTAYLVNVHHLTHTCPANAEPHPYDTRRTIAAVSPGGPCRNPITVSCGGTSTVIDCGRHEPAARQCPACRITVIERTVTFTHTGHHGSQHPTTGIAA